MSIIGIIADGLIGGTFLDWSLHYVNGCSQTFNAANKNFVVLPESPLSKTNAHNFHSNHPTTLSDLKTTLNNLNTTPSNLHSIYFHNLRTSDHLPDLQTICSDTKEAIEITSSFCSSVVRLSLDNTNTKFLSKLESRSDCLKWGSTTLRLNNKEPLLNHIQTFYKTSLHQFKPLHTLPIWDLRELIALTFLPTNFKSITTIHSYDFNFFDLDSNVLWRRFDTAIFDLFEYLNLTVDSQRYNKWIEVYQNWQNIIAPRLRFIDEFDTIIYNILNNIDYNIDWVDLVQEATIQHTLIKDYNLNFKTWQLEKFINTKQLHNLLEDSTHIL